MGWIASGFKFVFQATAAVIGIALAFFVLFLVCALVRAVLA